MNRNVSMGGISARLVARVVLRSASGPTSMAAAPLEVFAHLVMALVFKTSVGFEKGSMWVRFPYTSVAVLGPRPCLAFAADLATMTPARTGRIPLEVEP